MKAKRHTPNQITRKLREAERMLGEGKTTAEVAKALEVSEVTFHRWRNQYGGMKADDAKRLARDPRSQGDLEGKLLSPSRRRKAVRVLCDRLELPERRAC